MQSHLKGYVLTTVADTDLETIFDYTNNQFGFTQAVRYLNDLETVFNSLVQQPKMGRVRDEIKNDLLSITEQEHIIFYKVTVHHIKIIRVLHGSADLPTFFRK